tara:strand:- start:762 stop:1310 length:549 start_codon:yes stop_codon:yes gene_type:complete
LSKGTPHTTHYLAVAISQSEDIEIDIVKKVLEKFVDGMTECLKKEIPFQISGFGKFYFTYRDGANLMRRVQAKGLYDDKVHRELQFRVSANVKCTLNGWVHDLGLKTNLAKDTVVMRIKPEEILKIRRTKLLEDQRSMGFDANLLFDEGAVPEHDQRQSESRSTPSIDDMLEKLGQNINMKS